MSVEKAVVGTLIAVVLAVIVFCVMYAMGESRIARDIQLIGCERAMYLHGITGDLTKYCAGAAVEQP